MELQRATFIGCDIGQSIDYTAIAVVRNEEYFSGGWRCRCGAADVEGAAHMEDAGCRPKTATRRTLAALGRLPLGTPYRAIGERVAAMAAEIAKRDREAPLYVVADATGCGRPVVDEMVRPAVYESAPGVNVAAATITGGGAESFHGSPYSASFTVPKVHLISNLAVVVEQGELKMRRRVHRLLRPELLAFQRRINEARHEQLGAAGGKHDDMVLAVALACLFGLPGRIRSVANPWA